MSIKETLQNLWKKSKYEQEKNAHSKPPTPKQRIGHLGEEACAKTLTQQGMRLLHRNWRHASLELDIIAEDAQGVVFVEVKTRKATGMTTPLEGITLKKQRTLCKAAQVWIMEHKAWQKSCRFAVACVTYTDPVNPLTYRVEFYDNAFDQCTVDSNPLGGGNTPWQPW